MFQCPFHLRGDRETHRGGAEKRTFFVTDTYGQYRDGAQLNINHTLTLAIVVVEVEVEHGNNF